MCVSPVTRSPGFTDFTSAPTLSTTPVNSCPKTSGVLMRDAAHRSQSTMWRSVPQIANAVTRIRTSFGPPEGIGPSILQSPGSAFDFSIAQVLKKPQVQFEQSNGTLFTEAPIIQCFFTQNYYIVWSFFVIPNAQNGSIIIAFGRNKGKTNGPCP